MAARTPSVPTQRRIRRTPADAEREILGAAEAFLQENHFRNLTVDGVMAATGMKRSAFYNYFADRNALILRLLQDIEAEMMQAISPWLERSGDPETALRTGLEQVAQIYGLHGHLLRAIHEASFHDDDVERAYRQVVDDFVEVVAALLRRENRSGRTAIPRPRRVAEALLTMNTNLLMERLGRARNENPRAVAETLQFIWERTIYGGVHGEEAPGTGNTDG
ncbi:MAG TPA: TetR/AcrR family transcriptional regulator [Isosphaeraceae bacterium]|nr:TetR/AcrR family transcriptional regulator [Isosphaeraceae bacterium]